MKRINLRNLLIAIAISTVIVALGGLLDMPKSFVMVVIIAAGFVHGYLFPIMRNGTH